MSLTFADAIQKLLNMHTAIEAYMIERHPTASKEEIHQMTHAELSKRLKISMPAQATA